MKLPLILALLATPATAATVTWTDIDPVDAIGTGCIDGGGPDDQFPSAGKGDRAPAFCLPEPCARALTADELNYQVIGRPVTQYEWDTYYSRYAEACVAEAVNPDADRSTPRTLWRDTIRTADAATTLAGWTDTGHGYSIWTGPQAGTPTPTIIIDTLPDGGGIVIVDMPPAVVPPVPVVVTPLPASAWMLLAALAGLFAWGRRV